ncbi:MAG: hypothetical protein HY424_03375 [Candidatus Levybacteria bacterium]|nr:hypothetical protein [Candidatus Levybacteria bacterium]
MNIDLDELLLAKALLKKESKRIYDWVVGDVRKCCRLKKDGSYKRGASSLIGSFILWCCAVDYYGGLFMGVKKYTGWDGKITMENYSTRSHIKNFTGKYLKKYGDYDANKIYELRNSLIHNYTLAGYQVVEHDPNESKNNLKWSNKGYILHLGAALGDLEKAVKNYLKDLKSNDELKIRAFQYYKLNPILKPMAPEEFLYYKL